MGLFAAILGVTMLLGQLLFRQRAASLELNNMDVLIVHTPHFVRTLSTRAMVPSESRCYSQLWFLDPRQRFWVGVYEIGDYSVKDVRAQQRLKMG